MSLQALQIDTLVLEDVRYQLLFILNNEFKAIGRWLLAIGARAGRMRKDGQSGQVEHPGRCAATLSKGSPKPRAKGQGPGAFLQGLVAQVVRALH